MGHPSEPIGHEVLRLFYYILREDQSIVRSEVRRQTAKMVAHIKAAVARSTATLERLRVKQERETRVTGAR